MDNVVLINAGVVSDKKNFRTVLPGVHLKNFESLVTYNRYMELKKMYPSGIVNVFAVGKDSDFEKIKVGDYAWFCSRDEYHTLAKISKKITDENLGNSLWHDTQKNYEKIIFLENIIEIKNSKHDIFSRTVVQNAVDLSENYRQFGAHILDDKKSNILIQNYKLDQLTGEDKYNWDDTNKIIPKKIIEIRTIEEYIEEIQKIIVDKNDSKLFVYRGEKKDYGKTSCMPNIFREKQYIESNEFEKSLYDDMYSKGIISKQSSLETAIEAQHGGFPSRLLDVSYNALIALYFATEYKDWEKIDSNSIVTIFNIDEIFIPGAHNSEELFEEIIHPESKLRKLRISAFNHKLIDHMNKNDRIKAQQGAFILFQGKEYRPIPEVMYKKIEINKNYIKKIHKDLDRLFGINIGKIYPEAHNQIELIKARNKFINSQSYSLENEFEISLKMFNRINVKKYEEMKEYIEMVLKNKTVIDFSRNEKNKLVNKVNIFEESILVFREEFEVSLNDFGKILKNESKISSFDINKKIKKLIEKHNVVVNNLYDKLYMLVSKIKIECSDREIFLINGENLNYEKTDET